MLASQAARIEKRAKAEGLAGFDVISILSMLLPFLCKAVNPAPVNPTPNPSPLQADAWNQAWQAKSAAVDNWDGEAYRPATINKAAAKIRQQHKRDGAPIKKHEAQRLALIVLDDARTAKMPDLYSSVLDAIAGGV